ncbi:MAG: biotin/lipoyl-binding protein [Bacteroidales bacterium]
MSEELKHIKKVEIRSEEVQEILGKPPNRIIRVGISVMLIVLIVLLIGSWFFKYPEVINARIILTTVNPPATLKANTSGKIVNLFASEGDTVRQGQVLAEIENSANYQHVIYLSRLVDTLENPAKFNDSLQLKLGEIQSVYSSHIRLIQDYESFKRLNYHENKINAIKQEQKDYQIYQASLYKQKQLKRSELNLSRKQFRRDSILFSDDVIAESDFEKAEVSYLQKNLLWKM